MAKFLKVVKTTFLKVNDEDAAVFIADPDESGFFEMLIEADSVVTAEEIGELTDTPFLDWTHSLEPKSTPKRTPPKKK